MLPLAGNGWLKPSKALCGRAERLSVSNQSAEVLARGALALPDPLPPQQPRPAHASLLWGTAAEPIKPFPAALRAPGRTQHLLGFVWVPPQLLFVMRDLFPLQKPVIIL